MLEKQLGLRKARNAVFGTLVAIVLALVAAISCNGTAYADESSTDPQAATGPCQLTISKVATAAEADEIFDFSVTFTTTAGAPYTDEINYRFSGTGGTMGDDTGTVTPDENGVLDFSLFAGGSVTFSGIKSNTAYSVEEAAYDFWTPQWTGATTGTLPRSLGGGYFSYQANLTCRNQPTPTGGFIVEKQADGAFPAGSTFNFTVTLDKPLSGTFGDVNFTKGTGAFSLSDGGSVSITGLPAGTEYTVTETSSSLYETTWQNGNSGTIVAGAMPSLTLVCVNTWVGEPNVVIEKEQSVGDGAPTKDTLTIHEGDVVTYYVTVTNNGTGTSENVQVTDRIPEGLTYVEGSVTMGGYLDPTNTYFTWQLGTLEPGESITVSFQCTVPAFNGPVQWDNIAGLFEGVSDEPTPSNKVTIEGNPSSPGQPGGPGQPGQSGGSGLPSTGDSTWPIAGFAMLAFGALIADVVAARNARARKDL